MNALLSAPTLPRQSRIVQLAFVVNDLERAALRWAKTMGVGPFFLMKHVTMENLFHRGSRRIIDASFALAQGGALQIELVQQHDAGPSAYRDTVPAGREGFHHVAVLCDYARERSAYEALGFVVAQEGQVGDTRFCYIDTSATLGCMVEIIEHTPTMRAVFDAVAAAAEDWDGRDPLRMFA